jgi:hypothetical protein
MSNDERIATSQVNGMTSTKHFGGSGKMNNGCRRNHVQLGLSFRHSNFGIISLNNLTRCLLPALCVFLFAGAEGQIQVDLKFKRLQYIAYEPVIATLGITNLAGRDVDLHDTDGQAWFGFEVTGSEGQPIAPTAGGGLQAPLKIQTGQRVTQRIDVAARYPVHDFGTYHVRAHIYFADLGKFFYSASRVFEVTDARPIWQQTVGIPDGVAAPGDARTYSLLSNRFPDHTSLYVRVQDRDTGIVYATYSLGRSIAFEQPQAEIDRTNQLHVLHCAAPRAWTYSRVGLNGELLGHSSFMETKTRPRLVRSASGDVAVRGGVAEAPAAQTKAARGKAPKLSDRPPAIPKDNR